RSAAWTLAVLQRLEEEFSNQKERVLFPYHIRLITGASGGMLGAAAYTLGLPAPGKERDVDPATQFDRLTMDGLSPVMHRMFYGDLWGIFLPSPRRFDRGQALEQAWSENMGCLLDRPFGKLKEEEAAGWRPSLAFSPMLIEDGRRLLVSNLDLRGVVRNNGNLLDPMKDSKNEKEKTEASEFSKEAGGLVQRLSRAPGQVRGG